MTEQQTNRAANASIKGYLYQFDRTIIELLNAASGTTVTVEGIEDIDLENTDGVESVQCKYLEAAKFSLAKVRPAVLAMVQSSLNDQALNYRLYIHCGEEGEIPTSMTLEEIKQCLTSKSREGVVTLHYDGISDEQLESFAGRFSIVAGDDFDTNRDLVHTMIQTALHCTVDDSKDLYYGNALAAINGLAIQKSVSKRKTTKTEFLKVINTREALYTRWHKEVVGIENYLIMLKRRAKANQVFDPIKSRYLIIGASSTLTKDDYVAIITALARTHYGIGKLSNARPWTVVTACEAALLEDMKKDLIATEVVYNDGYENMSFSPVLFDRWPIVNTANKTGKIGATSYDIRLISDATYRTAVADLTLPDRVVAITDAELSEYGWPSMPQALQVTDITASQLKELLGV